MDFIFYLALHFLPCQWNTSEMLINATITENTNFSLAGNLNTVQINSWIKCCVQYYSPFSYLFFNFCFLFESPTIIVKCMFCSVPPEIPTMDRKTWRPQSIFFLVPLKAVTQHFWAYLIVDNWHNLSSTNNFFCMCILWKHQIINHIINQNHIIVHQDANTFSGWGYFNLSNLQSESTLQI